MEVVYEDGFSFEHAGGIEGYFSFSLYTPNSNPNMLDSSFENHIYHSFSIENEVATLTYIYGITSYLIVCSGGAFANWKVLIHTNHKTRESNPKMFQKFKEMGAIIGTVDENIFFKSAMSDEEVAKYIEETEKKITEAQARLDAVTLEYQEANAAYEAASALYYSKFAEVNALFLKLKNVSITDEEKASIKEKYEAVRTETSEADKAKVTATRMRSELSDKMDRTSYSLESYKNRSSRILKAKQSIIRVTRYYPLFHSNSPVFVRDADTIFADLIRAIMFGYENINGTGFEINPRLARKFDVDIPTSGPVAKSDHKFPNSLANWEAYCLQQCKKFATKEGTTFFMGIDNYTFNRSEFNEFGNINAVNVYLKDMNPEHLGRIRGLAGLLCSLKKLPLEALTYLPPLIKKVLHSRVHIHFIDEIYLSYHLYRILKTSGTIGFIVANYVLANPARKYICSEYKRQIDKYIDDAYLTHIRCDGYVRYNIEDNMRFLYQLFFIKHPNIHIPDQAFYNPLKDPEFTKFSPNEHIKRPNGTFDMIPSYIKNNNAENKNIRFTSYPTRSLFRRSKDTRKRKSRRHSTVRRKQRRTTA
jgi:hypothetical protein